MATLVTLEEYRRLTPRQQGYVARMQAEREGSPLRDHQENPYPVESRGREEWDEGQRLAVQVAQDGDEE